MARIINDKQYLVSPNFSVINEIGEVAQLGRAPGLGPGGRRFESCLPDLCTMYTKQHTIKKPIKSTTYKTVRKRKKTRWS